MTRNWTYDQCLDQMIEAMRAFAALGPATLPKEEAERVKRTLDAADSAIPTPRSIKSGRPKNDPIPYILRGVSGCVPDEVPVPPPVTLYIPYLCG